MSSDYENEKKKMLKKMGYKEITRAAGSLGKDLVMRNKNNQFIAVEIKSNKKNKNGNWRVQISQRKKTKEQYDLIKQAYNQDNLPIFYDVRWKRHPDHHGIEDDWRRWEAFLIANEEKHMSLANQKWPSFSYGEGMDSKKVWKELLYTEDPYKTLEQLATKNR